MSYYKREKRINQSVHSHREGKNYALMVSGISKPPCIPKDYTSSKSTTKRDSACRKAKAPGHRHKKSRHL